MSRGYWIVIVAVGLILSAGSGKAQEEAGNEQREATQQEQPPQALPIPLPINIIEDKASAESRERRESEAHQNQIDDLVAQQGMNAATQAMNEATQRMALYSLISTVLVGIGTALLIVTLYLTRQANEAAREAVEVTREIGNRQLRAYVHAMSPTVFDFKIGKKPYIRYQPKNTGQTPAHRYRQVTRCLIVPDPDTAEARFGGKVMNAGLGDIAAGQHLDQRSGLPEITQPMYDAILAKRLYVLFFGVIRYEDIFGRKRRTIFRTYMNVDTLEDGCAATNVCIKNNKST